MKDPESMPAPMTATHWGAYRVVVEHGKPVALRPFEGDPDPSPIAGGMLDTLSGPGRVARPAVRRGFLEARTADEAAASRTLRGREAFVEIPWDEALDLVARELDRVRDRWGNEAIYAGSYGWASAGRFHHAQSQLRRFMNLFGGATTSRDSYSYAAAEVILPHVVAPMAKLLIEHTSWRSIRESGALVVAFGGMAPRNGQVNAGGLGAHSQRADLLAARDAGVEFVNVSPVASDALEALGAGWLAVRPNTDVALMMGLAHTLVTEGLHDTAFLDRYCTGFDRFSAYLMGTVDGCPRDARWAARVADVPAETIVALARRMARTPTMLSASWSLSRQQNGEQCYWMLVTLAAMLGGIGRPGTGFSLGLGAVNGVGSDRGYLPAASLPSGENPVERFIPVARIADMLLHPGEAFDYNGRQYRYPRARLVYWAGGNPFHHHQDLNRLRHAWERIETVVVHEPFWTPLARHADVVLPATVALERNDFAASPRDDHLFAMQRVATPHGEARNDHDIFAGLAHRLRAHDGEAIGFADRFTGGRGESAWVRALYEETRRRGDALGHRLPDYDTFVREGYAKLEPPQSPRVMLDDFREDPEANPLPTPSGRIEISSETIERFAIPGQPGHPVWREPGEWLGSPRTAHYPLHLVSHQPERRLHGQLDHGAHSRAGKIDGREPCRMHPAEAARRGIADGDHVRIFNDRGATSSIARTDARVREGVVTLATGAWYDPDRENDPDCCKHGNPNTLTADLGTSPIAQGPTALTCLVEVARMVGPAPEVTAHQGPELERRRIPGDPLSSS